MSTRKRIDMRLPENLLDAIDRFCAEKQITRTTYFEMLARSDLKRRKREPRQKYPRWTGDVEDMPLHPA